MSIRSPAGSASPLPLVLVTATVPRACLAPLKKIARIVTCSGGGNTPLRAEVLRLAPKLSAIISQGELQVDAELLARAPGLRIVASASVGVDKLDLGLMARHGVYATNAPDYFVEATADFTLGMIIALLRRLPKADRYVRAGQWRSFQPGAWDGRLLRDKTLGLVGYGAIGRAVARRAAGFGLKVIHYQRTRTAAPGYTPLNSLLARADIVSLHVPLNQDSRGMIGAAQLRKMKRGACLVNISRGPVLDEAALIKALASGRLSGAALDVFADEPRVPLALRRRDNVVLTPHMGGGTRESREQSCLTCARNVALVLAGRRPDNLQNLPISSALRKWRSPQNK
ncbi:MAG: D-glycerate dehydrogenase [Opitutaceae bacterium]|nr:D-glycerate dehydrogenase [Opitutaceae bacterium]